MFEWFTWEWVAGLGIAGVLGIGAVIFFSTGSIKATVSAMVTAGLAVLYAAGRRKGQEEGRNAERAAAQKAATKRAERRRDTNAEIDRLGHADVDKRLSRWQRKDD